MKLSNKEQALLAKVRKAIEYDKNGDPIRDVMDDLDILDALELLIEFHSEYQKQS